MCIRDRVDINCIRISKTNPRKLNLNDENTKRAIDELAESIKNVGMINPITVRSVEPMFGDDIYEVISGERRFYAAEFAGLTEVPVIVRDITDEQILEIQIIENLQRRDVNAIEEADGYKALVKSRKYSVDEVAKRVGKSLQYVYNRLKLVDLIQEVKDDIISGYLSIGHGIQIAKLGAEKQKEVYEYCAYDFRKEKSEEPRSVSNIHSYIKISMLDLDEVCFSLKDEKLLKAAGSCVNCVKRTGYDELLFPEYSKNMCTDKPCLNAKVEAHLQNLLKKDAKKYGKVMRLFEWTSNEGDDIVCEVDIENSVEGGCESTVRGVWMEGDNIGKAVWVCCENECEIHNGDDSGSSVSLRDRALNDRKADGKNKSMTGADWKHYEDMREISREEIREFAGLVVNLGIKNIHLNKAMTKLKKLENCAMKLFYGLGGGLQPLFLDSLNFDFSEMNEGRVRAEIIEGYLFNDSEVDDELIKFFYFIQITGTEEFLFDIIFILNLIDTIDLYNDFEDDDNKKVLGYARDWLLEYHHADWINYIKKYLDMRIELENKFEEVNGRESIKNDKE